MEKFAHLQVSNWLRISRTPWVTTLPVKRVSTINWRSTEPKYYQIFTTLKNEPFLLQFTCSHRLRYILQWGTCTWGRALAGGMYSKNVHFQLVTQPKIKIRPLVLLKHAIIEGIRVLIIHLQYFENSKSQKKPNYAPFRKKSAIFPITFLAITREISVWFSQLKSILHFCTHPSKKFQN